ncbi:helix-turn-helix domain-containing protein [Nitratiruptor tergarcus]|uniref:Helix-turn-helix domain-containing protein n=1 Tax=Nitratiruptor tergarcus DSM 16512 TaxID=1069081 RepID=A0A1W1WSE6_9BACT|nr:helix-turn-helix domain-containing protein [Nitratiruptor tergarcus]SMC08960.1 Helix-turn-helix domain-containing protein [Nitratiruptor tergarcus DSM 16512]
MTTIPNTSTNIQDLQAKEFLSPKEVELLYGFKENTQAKWRMQGLIPYRKIGKFIRYHHQELKEWMNKGRIA